MTFAQAMLLAILQGFSELFPISSLGHTVLIPALLHWNIDLASPSFLAFVVVLHLGTALALLVFYWREWRGIVVAFLESIVRGRFSGSTDEKTAWLLVVGTVPVGLLGLFFEHQVRSLFASPIPVAIFLAINGLVMFAGEWLRGKDGGQRPLVSLSYFGAAKVGLAEALALLPGISRSGTAIVAGLLMNLSEDEAARFSFLLGTPVILAAGVLEVPRLFDSTAHVELVQAILGGILSAVTAYISLAFLTRYFRSNDLRPFGWYCVAAGTICFVLFFSGMVKA